MKHFRATLALASLMSLGGTAWADIYPITFERGVPTDTWFGVLQSLDASTRIDMSEHLLGALNVLSAQVDGTFDYLESYAIEAPYKKIDTTLDTDSWEVRIQRVTSDGGVNISTNALLPNGRKNVASTGGSFTITALIVAPSLDGVYANIVGGNGVGAQNMVRLWDAAGFSGSTLMSTPSCPLTPMTPCDAPSLEGFQFGEMYITSYGFDLMAQSLGLTAFGKSSLAGVTTYGSISVSSVPEPGSAGLMVIGLAALAYAGRRASLASPAQSRA